MEYITDARSRGTTPPQVLPIARAGAKSKRAERRSPSETRGRYATKFSRLVVAMDAARLASLWAEFKAEHARQYATEEEAAHRFDVFTENMNDLAEMQAEYPSEAPSGPSRYSDLTDEEVAALSAHLSEAMGAPPQPPPQLPPQPSEGVGAPPQPRAPPKAAAASAPWAPLMPSDFDAEASAPLVLRQFLSPAQVDECLAAGAARAPMPGASALSVLRDVGLGARQPAPGPGLRCVPHDLVYSAEHVVLYLHRRGHVQEQHPALWAHLLRGMRTQPGEWGCPQTPLSVRCCELHTYAAGGSLMDPSHTDDGSALTLSVLLAAAAGHGEMARYGEMARSGEMATLSPDDPSVMITHPMAVRP